MCRLSGPVPEKTAPHSEQVTSLDRGSVCAPLVSAAAASQPVFVREEGREESEWGLP